MSPIDRNFNPASSDLKREAEIINLLNTPTVSIEKTDKAFEIAKTIDNVEMRRKNFHLIALVFLDTYTFEGCKKAYEAAQIKSKELGAVREIYLRIFELCEQLETRESLNFATKLGNQYSMLMSKNVLRREFKSVKTIMNVQI